MNLFLEFAINLVVICGLFLFIGALYPTESHRKMGLKYRGLNFFLFFIAVCMYFYITQIAAKQVIIDILDAIAAFILVGAFYVTNLHHSFKLRNQILNLILFFILTFLSIGVGMGEAKIGQPVKLFDRTYTVHHVEELKQIKNSNGGISVPDKGTRFIKINVSVKNEGSEAISIPVDEIILHKSDDYKRDAINEKFVNEANQSLFYEINPGVTRTANVLFVVPNTVSLHDLVVRVMKADLSTDILFQGEVKIPILYYLFVIIFIIVVIAVSGMIIPSSMYHELGLNTRLKNFYLFLISMTILYLIIKLGEKL